MKTKYLAIIALAMMFVACDRGYKHQNVELNNADDSICYAMGTMTGVQLSQYIDSKNDSLDGRAEVLKGLRKGVNDNDEYAKFGMIGEDLARMLEQMDAEGLLGDSTLDVDKAKVIQGLINTLLDDASVTTFEGANPDEYLRNFQMEKTRKQMLERYSENKKAGEDFLAANKEKKGVFTTESGIQYEILKKGNGKKPLLTDNVRVHYHGTLIDGTVFDSSVDRKEPAEFGLMGVIKGWQEILQMMPVGSKWRVYIPQELAYGDREMGNIKPFSVLIFDIELIKILDKENK